MSSCKRLAPTSNGLKNDDRTFTEPRGAGCCAFAAAPHASMTPVTSTLVHLQAEISISLTSSNGATDNGSVDSVIAACVAKDAPHALECIHISQCVSNDWGQRTRYRMTLRLDGGDIRSLRCVVAVKNSPQTTTREGCAEFNLYIIRSMGGHHAPVEGLLVRHLEPFIETQFFHSRVGMKVLLRVPNCVPSWKWAHVPYIQASSI